MKRAVLNSLGPITHILAGLVVPAWAFVLGYVQPSVGLIIVTIVAALLPDIDTAASLLGRIFEPISEWLEHNFGHRTLTHTILTTCLFGLFCWLWFPASDGWIILSAYISHLVIDMIVGERGIPLLWPLTDHYFYIIDVKAGSAGELLVTACCAVLVLYPLHIPQSAQTAAAAFSEVEATSTRTPTPTATPGPLIIKIDHVYDPDTEILVQPGDYIDRGQLLADLATYRHYNPMPATPSPAETAPTATPTPAPTGDLTLHARLEQTEAALALAEARWNKAMQQPNEIYEKQIAEAELRQARADYHAAMLKLTPTLTPPPEPTATTTPGPPLEDLSRVYSKITGLVSTVRIAALTNNWATIEIHVYPAEVAATLWPNTFTTTPNPPTPTATASPSPIPTSQSAALTPQPTNPQPPTANPQSAFPNPQSTWVVITATPTPATIATAAAISLHLTAQATQFGPATPLPAHFVTPIIVTSTPVPANHATVEYHHAAALTTGTPTPLPPNVWTATPTPVLIADPLATLTPTITATPTPAQLPEPLLGHILFLSDRDGGTTDHPIAYAFDPATGHLARLSNLWPYQAARSRESWSADGRYQVYTQRLLWSNIQTEQGNIPIDELQLHLYDHHYHTEHLITQMGAGLVYGPAWSPVSDEILFVATESGNDEIWLTHRDGSALHQLTRNHWEWDKTPSWSPDGQQIVFYSNRTGNNQLWLMNKDGEEQRLLLNWTPHNDWDPVWVKTLAPPPQKERQTDWRFSGEGGGD